MLDLDAMEALLEKATPGPWEARERQPMYRWKHATVFTCDGRFVAEMDHSHSGSDVSNAALIVALRNAAGELIALARRTQQAEREQAHLHERRMFWMNRAEQAESQAVAAVESERAALVRAQDAVREMEEQADARLKAERERDEWREKASVLSIREADLLVDADASTHWQTRAERAEAQVKALREALEYFKGADEADVVLDSARQPDAALREVCEKVVWATKARCEDYHARYKMQVLPFNGADAEHVVSSILGPRETVERVAHAGSTHSKTLPEASHE